ncbi:S10 family serine carboxypeptidase-like protein [Hyphococcus sp.]|uniref:S10 family serine carboxypeptidase-like protein n=1 Tax=Hyphococcus sp. TaxID=2038636 RepID=UPI0035C6F191
MERRLAFLLALLFTEYVSAMIYRFFSVLFTAVFAFTVNAVAGEAGPRIFASDQTAMIEGAEVAYRAEMREFTIEDGEGREALRLFASSYMRTDVENQTERPVMFVFNGGPIAAAFGLHMEWGPKQPAGRAQTRYEEGGERAFGFIDNDNSLLDVADLVFFDPADTGFSRITREESRNYFYSVDGDAETLVQLIEAWTRLHGRERSPLFLLGESYGSIRQVVAGAKLREKGVHLNGHIIFGDSIFLMETSRRSHNIISTAVSLPVLALAAAYHDKADMRGKDVWGFLDEVYDFAMSEYLLALAKGYSASQEEREETARRLEAYTGIPADYYLANGLAIAKHVFNKKLIPGKELNANDLREAETPAADQDHLRAEAYAFEALALQHYMRDVLGVSLPDTEYRLFASDSFSRWEWGQGCSDYLAPAGLCNKEWGNRTPFVDYDWPDQLKAAFSDPAFRVMIVSGIYDGLSSVGTHRYLKAQLGFPEARFDLYEYEAGHAAAADRKVRPKIKEDILEFLDDALEAQ